MFVVVIVSRFRGYITYANSNPKELGILIKHFLIKGHISLPGNHPPKYISANKSFSFFTNHEINPHTIKSVHSIVGKHNYV